MNKEIQRFIKRLTLNRPIESYPVTITTTQVNGRAVHFCTNLDNDPIQRKHRKGIFYEMHELRAIGEHLPEGGTFVDIGANVGNHSLYAAMFHGAGRVIPLEPNPKAYRLLLQNMLINGVADRIDFSKLGCGVSDVTQDGYGVEDRTRNLGGTRMIAEGGALKVFRADELLVDETPDVIKIDVEGMEMAVLRGLSGILARCKPAIQIEIDAEHDAEFLAWAENEGYRVAETVRRYRNNLNYLLVHPDATKVKRAKASAKARTSRAAPATATAAKAKSKKALVAASKTAKSKPGEKTKAAASAPKSKRPSANDRSEKAP